MVIKHKLMSPSSLCPSIACFRRQFSCTTSSIHLAFLRCAVSKMPFFSLTLCNRKGPPKMTYHFNTDKLKILCTYLEHDFRNVLCLMQKRLYDGRSDAQRQIFLSFLCILYSETLCQFKLNSQGEMAQALKMKINVFIELIVCVIGTVRKMNFTATFWTEGF